MKNSKLSSKIFRLSFPFGLGESRGRLFSKIIIQLLNNNKIEINNVVLNITPINSLLDNFYFLINLKDDEVNFTDGIKYSLIC